jgi:uncharacterized protein involved in exopolysaccharide biosynthesis
MMTQLTPRTLAHALFKRRRLFFGSLSAIVGGAILYVLFATPVYESSAALLMKINTQDMAAPDMLTNEESKNIVSSSSQAEQMLNSERLLLESEDVLRATLERLDPAYVYPDIARGETDSDVPLLDIAVRKLKKDLDVKVNQNSNVLLLNADNHNPVVAQKVLQMLITTFFDKQASITRDPRLNFIEDTREALRKKSNEAQQALLDFKKEKGINSLDAERDLMLKQRDSVQQSLNEAQAAMKSDQERLAELRKTLAGTPAEIPLTDENDNAKTQIDQARARLTNAQARYDEARLNFAEGNPELLDAKAQVDSARANFQEAMQTPTSRVRTGVNQIYQNVSLNVVNTQSDMNGLAATIDEKTRQLQHISDRLGFLDSIEPELLDLQHRQDIALQDFKSYLERTEAAKIVDDLNRAGITSLGILQSPTFPYVPAKPRKALVVGLSLFVGLLAALGLCLLAEALDETISLPEQVESALELPLLLILEYEAGATNRKRLGHTPA